MRIVLEKALPTWKVLEAEQMLSQRESVMSCLRSLKWFRIMKAKESGKLRLVVLITNDRVIRLMRGCVVVHSTSNYVDNQQKT